MRATEDGVEFDRPLPPGRGVLSYTIPPYEPGSLRVIPPEVEQAFIDLIYQPSPFARAARYSSDYSSPRAYRLRRAWARFRDRLADAIAATPRDEPWDWD